MRFWLATLCSLATAASFAQHPITITFVHTNDLHAHIEPTQIRDANYGGYARHMTLFKQIRRTAPNPIFLNAGDVFQGTLYFNIYEGLADVTIMNLLGYDAMTLGNHEFDKGPGPLIEFGKRANFPLLAANLDTSKEPALGRLVKPSTVLNVHGQKVGIVGVITPDTPSISSPGNTVAFTETLRAAQREVDNLTAQGINKIVVMSHIGFDEDVRLARQLRRVDLVIGGHSHTPLGTPALPGWRQSNGSYPTVERDAEGKPIYIVQAWEWGKVVGEIQLDFDAKGRVIKVRKATPIVIDKTIREDMGVASFIAALRKPIDAIANEVVGEITEPLEDRTLVGHFVADSYLMSGARSGAVAAFMNPGGVRANLVAGPITYGEAVSVCPFRNTIVVADLTGTQLVTMLEQKIGLIPSTGSSYKITGNKVSEVVIAGAPLEMAKVYKVAVNNFMAGGGDGLEVLKGVPKIDTGFVDIDVWVEFLKKNRPLVRPQNRIRN